MPAMVRPLGRKRIRMSGNEWNSDTLDVIAEIVRLTGREILNSDEYDDA